MTQVRGYKVFLRLGEKKKKTGGGRIRKKESGKDI